MTSSVLQRSISGSERVECLQGLRTLELSFGPAGAYCGRLLSVLGAHVIKVEPPHSGDAVRRWPPFADDIPGIDRSLLFLNLNLNKRGITLDHTHAVGLDSLRDLCLKCDVLLLGDERPSLTRSEIDWLHSQCPELIIAAMRPFGLSGPHEGRRSEGLNLFMAGGSGYFMPGGLAYREFPEREPLNLPGQMSDSICGMSAAVAIVAAYLGRSGIGGQVIDCSSQEAHLSVAREHMPTFVNEGLYETRATNAFTFGGITPCKDGHVEIAAHSAWSELLAAMGNPEWGEDPRFNSTDGRIDNAEEIQGHIREWASARTKMELYRLAQAHGAMISPFSTAAEFVSSGQEQARGYFRAVNHPEVGMISYPTAPFILSGTPVQLSEGAPTLGQHNEEVYRELLDLDRNKLILLSRLGVI